MTSPAQTTSTALSSTGSGSPSRHRRASSPGTRSRARRSASAATSTPIDVRAGLRQRGAELARAAAEVEHALRRGATCASRKARRCAKLLGHRVRRARASQIASARAWGIAQVSQRAAPCKDRRVRILAVCAVAHPGGAEIGLLRLAKRLLARGHALTLATPAAGPLDDAGLPVVRLALGGLERGAGARAAASFPRARRLAAAHDLVYLNGTVSGRLLPGLAGRRTILHVHDIVDRVPRFWSRADAVLADSGAVAERLPGLHAHVVYCPVELDVPDAPAPWPPTRAAARPVVGFVGRIEPRKGPLDLVQAAPAIRAAHARRADRPRRRRPLRQRARVRRAGARAPRASSTSPGCPTARP